MDADEGGVEGNEREKLNECGRVRDGKVSGGVNFQFSWYKMSSSSFFPSLIRTGSLLTLNFIHVK